MLALVGKVLQVGLVSINMAVMPLGVAAAVLAVLAETLQQVLVGLLVQVVRGLTALLTPLAVLVAVATTAPALAVEQTQVMAERVEELPLPEAPASSSFVTLAHSAAQVAR